mmetsp:Transcript_52494/g.151258  ORF Transcript_52494/g.151258 Transcript_52494/m.151258 type:complete len:294 (-) Transcript_52494:397-1278(-)
MATIDILERKVAVETSHLRERRVRQDAPSEKLGLRILAIVVPHLEDEIVPVLVSIFSREGLAPDRSQRLEAHLRLTLRGGLSDDLEDAEWIGLAVRVRGRQVRGAVDGDHQPGWRRRHAPHGDPQLQRRRRAFGDVAAEHLYRQPCEETTGAVELRAWQQHLPYQFGLVALVPVPDQEQQAITLLVAVLVAEVLAPPWVERLLHHAGRGLGPLLLLDDLAAAVSPDTHHRAKRVGLAVRIGCWQILRTKDGDVQRHFPRQQVRIPSTDLVVQLLELGDRQEVGVCRMRVEGES